MKINKNWKPRTINCPYCQKDFTVKYELGTDDNCYPLFALYQLSKIFTGNGFKDLATPEEILQWLDISGVMFICPHCHSSFGSNESCRVCGKPLYVWMETIGATCSSECGRAFMEEALKNRENRKNG